MSGQFIYNWWACSHFPRFPYRINQLGFFLFQLPGILPLSHTFLYSNNKCPRLPSLEHTIANLILSRCGLSCFCLRLIHGEWNIFQPIKICFLHNSSPFQTFFFLCLFFSSPDKLLVQYTLTKEFSIYSALSLFVTVVILPSAGAAQLNSIPWPINPYTSSTCVWLPIESQ